MSRMAKVEHPRIVVDDREARGEAAHALQELGAKLEVKRLEVGDFVLGEQAAAERKTRADFESSILDGRLFGQARDLAENYAKPLLVVTGERFERLNKNALRGALISLSLDYRLPVIFVRDEAALARLLFHAARREQGEKRELRLQAEKHAFTLAEQQRFLVEALPGVGPELAKRLLERFGRVENVFTAEEQELMEVEGVAEEKARGIRRAVEARYGEEE